MARIRTDCSQHTFLRVLFKDEKRKRATTTGGENRIAIQKQQYYLHTYIEFNRQSNELFAYWIVFFKLINCLVMPNYTISLNHLKTLHNSKYNLSREKTI